MPKIPPSRVMEILARHHLRPQKGLGQNFLIDEAVPQRIVEESGIDGSCGVIEIGPGVGVLTEPLCRRAKKVVAIELDARMLPILKETLGGCPNLTLLQQDVLKVDLLALIEKEFEGLPVHVCSNLPYYITTPIILSLLEKRLPLTRVTVMVQKEVAERLCAPPGSKNCGAVSYAVSYYTRPGILFDVPPSSFFPAPEVTSTVISLEILKTPSVTPDHEEQFFKLISAAFSQRRKTLKNALTGAGYDKTRVAEGLAQLSLKENIRGECLTLEDFCKLSNFLFSRS